MPNDPLHDQSTLGPDWFAQPLQAAVPIAFLPLRLETRFGADSAGQPQLWIRAFPDDVHVDAFEPELTAAEQAARQAYLANPDASSPDADKRLAAWRSLAQRFGAARAAWFVSPAAANAGSKAADWTRPATTHLLPERLIFTAYDTEGGVVRQAGTDIADGLVLGPSPGGGDPSTDPDLAWMREFQKAVDVGMAIRLPITATQAAQGFTRVLVYGVNSKLSTAEGAQRLAAALDAHHYTDGVEVLPHGTPTNNADGVKAGYSSNDPGYARSFAVERSAPRVPSADGRADGDRLAAALGVPSSHFAFVGGSDGRHDDAPAAMNTVLWPATLGYYLQHMVAGAVPEADDVLAAARAHHAAWVRARGPWPALRLGRQPYGVIPVVSSRAYQATEGGPLLGRLFAVLQALRPFWQSSASQVPRVVPNADPDQTLATLLGMSPHSTSYAGRTVLGPQFSDYYWRFVGQTMDSNWFTRLSQLSTSQLGAAGPALAATRLGNAAYLNKHFSLGSVLVTAAPGDAPLTDNYLAGFTGMTLAQLRDAAPPASPVALLWLLARHAALRQYVDSAYELLGAAVAPADKLEPELVDISPAAKTARVWDQLAVAAPNVGPVGEYLDQHKQDGPGDFVEFWRALGALATTATAELEEALREGLDLASYRLDAWFTSLASERLDWVRKQSGNAQTLYLGAYGWVEDVRPAGQTASWGYVHAPSLAHATTAAVLRSGYLAHQAGGSSAAAIDLSSTRTRRALQLVESVRAGQPLGAQLGYQLERALHEHGLDTYIARFRTIVQTGEIAGDPVVDGLALLDQRAQLPWGTGDLPAAGSTEQVALDGLLTDLADAVDALSDLMLADSVHHLAGGSALRAGATVDALGRGDAPPPELEITRVPRRGGVITHRLAVLLPDAPAAGWPTTPRSQAEPRLAAFVAGLLGPPARVRARAELVGAAGSTLSTVALSLADTGLGPLDVLALVGRSPSPPGAPAATGAAGQSEIEKWLLLTAWARRPAGTPAEATVRLVLDTEPPAGPELLTVDELLTAAASARALLAGARGATAVDFSDADHTVDVALDTDELRARADGAVAALAAARHAFDDPGGADAALANAALFGVEGAVPALAAASWPAQVELVTPLLDDRLAQLAALEAGFSRVGAPAVALRDHDLTRLRLVFGRDFFAVAKLTVAARAGLTTLFAGSDALLSQPLDATTYFSRAARVRAGVRRLDESLLYAEALGSGARLSLSVAQLPAVPGEAWVGLPLAAGSKPVDRLSILALGAPQTVAAALFVDEWLETVPNARETTGLTFHVDDAKSRAPQAILLGVQPDAHTQWTLASVEGTLLEAIELAHMRAVDPDTLTAVGHFLPALFFAVNFATPTPDTISTDLTLAAPPPKVHPVDVGPIIHDVLGSA